MNVLEMKSRRRFTMGMITIGVLMYFMAVGAAGGWASTFQTVDGEVVIDAENYTRLGGTIGGAWYFNNEKSGYVRSGYMQSTTDDPGTLTFSTSISRVEYDIDFKETGTYYLHLRTYATDHSNNGFFAAVNGQQFDYGHPDANFVFVKYSEATPKWLWYTDGGGAGARGYPVSIDITTTGIKKLALYRRDKGTRIDRIWLTKHESLPQETATLSLTPDSEFLIGGARVFAPSVTTNAASGIGNTSAMLNASVNPNATSTTGHFEYGPTTAYGNESGPILLGSGTSSTAMNSSISGLECGTLYNFRAVAVNSAGTSFGSNLTFTTSACTVSAPVFNPDGGTQPGTTVNVIVSCATPGATIRYTTDGDEPNGTSPAVNSGGVVVAAVPGTLKAKAWLGSESSTTKTATYTRQVTTHSLSVAFAGRGTGELTSEPVGVICSGTNGDTCNASYNVAEEVTLVAVPEPGSIFKGWGGDCVDALGTVCTLTMDGDKTVLVDFILQGQANPLGDISVVNLTSEERDTFMNITDGTMQFPSDSSIDEVHFQNNTATIDYRDDTSQTVTVTDGEKYTDDFINLVLLNGSLGDEIFETLLALPSFEASVNSAGEVAQLYFPAIIPISVSPGCLVGDLELFKLKSIGQSSIFFRYRENSEDVIMDGDFWITEHLSDTILLPEETIEAGKVLDLYLVIEDNGLYDLDDTDGIIVDPLVLGRIEEESTPPPPTDNSATGGGGGGGCFIGTLTDRLF